MQVAFVPSMPPPASPLPRQPHRPPPPSTHHYQSHHRARHPPPPKCAGAPLHPACARARGRAALARLPHGRGVQARAEADAQDERDREGRARLRHRRFRSMLTRMPRGLVCTVRPATRTSLLRAVLNVLEAPGNLPALPPPRHACQPRPRRPFRATAGFDRDIFTGSPSLKHLVSVSVRVRVRDGWG